MKRYYIENIKTPFSELFVLKRKETADSEPDMCMAVEISPDNMTAFTCPEYVDLYPKWDYKANVERPECTFEITAIEFNIYAAMFNDALKYEDESKRDPDTIENLHNGQISSAFVNELKRVTANAIQLFYLLISTTKEDIRKAMFDKSAGAKRHQGIEDDVTTSA